MTERTPFIFPTKRSTKWALAMMGSALLWTGCASAPPEPEVTQRDMQQMQQRLHDVERTNGRLMVRVEESERQISLMQDRVEANRIALQRHGHLRRDGDRFAAAQPRQQDRHQRPAPAPQSNYRQRSTNDNYSADPSMQQRMQRRGGTRIQLSDQQSGRSQDQNDHRYDGHDEVHHEQQGRAQEEQEVLVITNAELEARFGPSRQASPPSSQRSSSSSSSEASSPSSTGSSSGRRAHPPVTDSRLPTTDELRAAQEQEGRATPSSANDLSGASAEELMELYQDSLAHYRAGDYSSALVGFTDFLDAGPRADYVDNALYWIGECHYGLGEYDVSVRQFQRILDDLPGADKVPDAMLKMSLAYDRMGQPDRAVRLLEDLIDTYPNSNPGRLGKERLAEHPNHDGS